MNPFSTAASAISALVMTAHRGTAPPSPLEQVTMSGTKSKCSKANHLPVRPKQVRASSATVRMSRSRQISTIRWIHSLDGTICPAALIRGSKKKAAGRPEVDESITFSAASAHPRLQQASSRQNWQRYS